MRLQLQIGERDISYIAYAPFRGGRINKGNSAYRRVLENALFSDDYGLANTVACKMRNAPLDVRTPIANR
jgi:hypothetical protein